SEWRGRGLGYALLVGDVDVLPVRYMCLDRVTPAAFDYAFYPSDLYYSDLAKADGSFEDWNARKESFHAGYFGEVRGEKNKQDPINFDQVDYLPDIAAGRSARRRRCTGWRRRQSPTNNRCSPTAVRTCGGPPLLPWEAGWTAGT